MQRLRDPAALVRLADACAALVAIVVLRDLLGGPESGIGPLVLLPVLFVAVKGSRTEVAIAVGLAVLAIAAPIVVVGGPEYPATEWGRAAVIAVVAAVAGWVVQRTMATHRETEANLAAVASVTRSLAHDDDTRAAVCRASCEVSGASVAMLAEPDGSGYLTVTAALGADAAIGDRVPIEDNPSGAAVAYASGRRLFVADAHETPAATGFAGRTKVASVLWEPVAAGARTIGVLVVAWERRISRPSDRAVRLIGLLAAEAATAIEREGLIGVMRQTARTDQLTGVLNERAWSDELTLELARSRRGSTPLCLALLDVDGASSDRALKELVAGWAAALRPGDRLARLDAGHFAVVLPGCAREDACRVLDRVRAVRPQGVSACIGLAQWDGREAPDALAGRVGNALDAARRDGPDRLVLA